MIVFVSALTTCVALGQTTQPTWKTIPEGQMILRPFENAPYPHASREDGFKSKNGTFPKDPHYIDSTVGIVIPKNYVPGDTVDYVVHFHGWNNHVSKLIPEYKLAEQLAATKVNAILIVPQGPKDASDSAGGKLEMDKGGFEKLIKEVTTYLNSEGKIHTDKIGTIVLSTHSGGYKMTAAILDHGGLADHISDVLLLDSSYGSLEWFAAWAHKPGHRMISLFTDHLAATNKEFMGILDKAGTKYQTLDEPTATDAQFATRTMTFIHVKGPHDEVPIQYFGRLLKTSKLGEPAK
jgi:hypothetical protein